MENISVDREPVASLIPALRASRASLLTLDLSADACYNIAHATHQQAADLSAALIALARPVHVAITGACTSYKPSWTTYNSDAMSVGIPLCVVSLTNGVEWVVRVTVFLLQCSGVASVTLPPLTVFAHNFKLRRSWDLMMAMFSRARPRLRCGEVTLDLYNYNSALISVNDCDVHESKDMTAVEMVVRYNQLIHVLAQQPVPMLTLYVDQNIDHPRFLQTMPITRLRIVAVAFEVNMDSLEEAAGCAALNLGIRGLFVFCRQFSEVAGNRFAFLRSLLGIADHVWSDGVHLFSGEHTAQPLATSPLDEALGKLRVGEHLCLDLLNVEWQPSTLRAVQLALERNVGVRRLQLSVLHLATGTPSVLDLPPHVTSADLHMSLRAVNLIFGGSASLPGLELLTLTLWCADGEEPRDFAGFLRGAPKLQQLALSLNGYWHPERLVRAIADGAPPTCMAVTIGCPNAPSGPAPQVAAIMSGCPRIRWTLRDLPAAVQRYAPRPATQ